MLILGYRVFVWSNHRIIRRFPTITQTFDRIRLFQNECKIFWRFSCGVQVLTSASLVQLLLLREFVLSYAIHFWVYLSQREVERTDLPSPNHNSRIAINYSAQAKGGCAARFSKPWLYFRPKYIIFVSTALALVNTMLSKSRPMLVPVFGATHRNQWKQRKFSQFLAIQSK